MKNINLEVQDYDFRPAFVFDDVDGLRMERINIDPTNEDSQIILRNVSVPVIEKVRIEGVQGSGVLKVN
jgi:hypothetical protein